MKKSVILLTALALAPTIPCFAGYKVDVTTKPGFGEHLSKVVVVTVICHERLDCRDIERKIGAKIPDIAPKLIVVPIDQVSQALLEVGKTKYEPSLRQQLLSKFAADAVLEVDVPYGEKGVFGWKGSESAVSLRLIATDGTLLLAGQGSGRARNTLSSPENIAREIAERILDKAFHP